MSGRGVESARTWLRGVLVIVVIAAVLGVFSAQTGFERPRLGALNVAGIAVMLIGLVAAIMSTAIAGRLPEAKRASAGLLVKLCGVGLCGIGAIMVFL